MGGLAYLSDTNKRLQELKYNWSAAVAPGVDDDIDAGYIVGSCWFDTTADKAYVCLDNTNGAAVWLEMGGGAVPKLDDCAAPDDNTDLDASTTKHGLCPKGTNTGTKYLRDDLTWQTPAGVSTPDLDEVATEGATTDVALVLEGGATLGVNGAGGAEGVLTLRDGANPGTTVEFGYVEAADLTDSGATTLHKHDHGNMDGLSDDDHTQYIKHALSTAENDFLVGGTGGAANTFVKKTLAETQAILGVSGGADTGDIKMRPVATPPSGWLLCDGRVVSRTTYSDLYAVVGTTFGAGDGSNTFRLPDFCGFFPIGAGGYGVTSVEDCEDSWVSDQGANVVVSHPADPVIGSACVKLAIGAGGSTGLMAHVAAMSGGSTELDVTNRTHVVCYVKSSIALNADDYRIALDNTAACTSPLEYYNIPAIPANEWTKVVCPSDGSPSGTNAVACGIYCVVDKGEHDLYIDDIRLGRYSTVGTSGGEDEHTLTTAELATHSHSHNHETPPGGYVIKTTGSRTMANPGAGTTLYANTDAVMTSDTDATTAGSGTAHNTLPPYQPVYWVIKT